MSIFNQYGHITSEGFSLLTTEKADELQRLELSEHLSFCDKCLEQYLNEMEKIPLLQTEQSIAQRVIKRVKSKTAFFTQKQFGRAVVAASIAMVLWSTGAFSCGEMFYKIDHAVSLEEGIEKMSWQNQNILHHVSRKYQQILHELDRREEIHYGKE